MNSFDADSYTRGQMLPYDYVAANIFTSPSCGEVNNVHSTCKDVLCTLYTSPQRGPCNIRDRVPTPLAIRVFVKQSQLFYS